MNANVHSVPRGRLGCIGLVVGVLSVGFVFQSQVADIAARGQATVEDGYVFLVPLVAAYLVLLRLGRLRGNERSRRGAWFGPVVVASSCICSAIGYDRDILVLWQAAPLIGMLGLIVAFVGMRRALALAPGLFVMFASLPVPGAVRNVIAGPLQWFATSVTASVLELLGADAQRVGNLIQINGVPVAVGEACNGMRLVMPLAIVMYAFVFSLPLRLLMRVFLIAMSLPVAIACNVVRLVPTSLAYGFFEDWAPFVHDVGGWLMIPLAILMMLGVLRAFEWFDLPVARLRLAVS